MCVQVRIVAGRPMHCQVPGIEYTMGKRAVQTMLEGATAIALSYNGILYIAETDEKKIHRIRQVISCFRTHTYIVTYIDPLIYSHFLIVRLTIFMKKALIMHW